MRRLRFPLALAALILLTGIAVAMLQPHNGPGYLDPNDPGPAGTRALAHILAHRGERVVRVSSAAQAARAAGPETTLVITGPAFLRRGELGALGRLPGDRFLVEPDSSALRALAPGLTPSGRVPVAVHSPACGLAAARLAGDADMGGTTLRVTQHTGATLCYPTRAGAGLVRYVRTGRTITVLTTGAPLTNDSLADRGNAALALNLLAAKPVLVWLTPGTAAVGGGRKTLISLIPWPAYLVAIQLAIAVLAAAGWRARRLGPLVAEPLPVVVRAAETVEGHGRLYRSHRARDRAADALRHAVVQRLLPRLGLPAGAGQAAITAAVAARCGRDATAVDALLFGAAPDTDGALAEFATTLDILESDTLKGHRPESQVHT